MSLLDVQGLTIRDRRTGGILVENLDFRLESGSCLGVAGESGSGKTLSCRALLGLLPATLQATGTAVFRPEKTPFGSVHCKTMDLLRASPEALRRIRGGRIAMVLQQPMTAFDPLCTIGDQFMETLQAHAVPDSTSAKNVFRHLLRRTISAAIRRIAEPSTDVARSTVLNLLRAVYIRAPEDVLGKYPHQLSGGMLQRCMIAIALALRPEIIIADEPTTALDAVSQRDVVEQLLRIREHSDTAMIFVSHDLGVIQALAQTLVIMKDGRCVESGPADEVLNNPAHPYTRYLIRTRMNLTQAFQQALRRPAPAETGKTVPPSRASFARPSREPAAPPNNSDKVGCLAGTLNGSPA